MKDIIYDLKEHLWDIISFILLLASLVFLFFNVYYNPLKEYNKTIQHLSDKYKKDEIKFHQQIKKLEDDQKLLETQDVEVELEIVPALLKRINDTCKAPEVIIRTLNPAKNNPFRFELNFIADYFDFLEVLSEFEKLNITIHQINIRPYEIKDTKPKHIINLDIEAIDGGEKLSKEDIEFLSTELFKKNKRDPFQRFAKIGKKIKRLVDLTWMYKLSGIGKIDGKFVATIDRRVYYEGSSFKDMKISKITGSKVLLHKNGTNGRVNYILKFRTNKVKKDDEKK
jgi:hypothetical protein